MNAKTATEPANEHSTRGYAPSDKRRTLAEVRRVLRSGGELHVADWERPQDPLMAVAAMQIRVFDGFERTARTSPENCPPCSSRQAWPRSATATASERHSARSLSTARGGWLKSAGRRRSR